MMTSSEERLELKVGLLVALTLVGLLVLLWAMGELSLGNRFTLWIDVPHTGSLVRGAPVKLGGVQVGRLDGIELHPDRRDENGAPLAVKLRLELDKDVGQTLRTDSVVTLATLGPLGEPYLEISPGSPDADRLKDGATLRAAEPPRLDLLAGRIAAFLDAASRLLEEDPRALSKLVTGVSELSLSLGSLVKDNQDELSSITLDLAGAAKDLHALSSLARQALEPGGKGAELLADAADAAKVMRRDLPPLTQRASQVLAQVALLTQGLTPEDGERFRVAIRRYAAAGEQLEKLAARGERILADVEAGKGTLGGLHNDPQVYNDLRALIKDLREHPWKVLWKK